MTKQSWDGWKGGITEFHLTSVENWAKVALNKCSGLYHFNYFNNVPSNTMFWYTTIYPLKSQKWDILLIFFPISSVFLFWDKILLIRVLCFIWRALFNSLLNCPGIQRSLLMNGLRIYINRRQHSLKKILLCVPTGLAYATGAHKSWK